jgi:hypothetical protein
METAEPRLCKVRREASSTIGSGLGGTRSLFENRKEKIYDF